MASAEGVDEKRAQVARVTAELLRQEIEARGRPDPSDAEEMRLLAAAHDLWRELDARADGTVELYYDPDSEVIVISGVAYAYDLFKALGPKGLGAGATVRIVGHEHGTVRLQRVEVTTEPAEVERAYVAGFNAHAEVGPDPALDDASDLGDAP